MLIPDRNRLIAALSAEINVVKIDLLDKKTAEISLGQYGPISG